MSSLSNPAAGPDQSHHFDLQSASEVPDSFVWPTLHDQPSASEPMPVIDLADRDAAGSIARACMSWGAFQVTGHRISPRLLDAIEAETRRLFVLPIQQKLKAASSPDGVSGYGSIPLSAFCDKLMWSEGFTISGSPVDHARMLWPHDHDKFCDVIEEYQKEMKALSGWLIRLMLLSLGLKFEDVAWAAPVGNLPPDLTGALRLNSYPACPEPDKAMGMVAHTDSSLFTILHQSGTTGLQVLRGEDQSGPARWVTAPLLPESLIVLVGDLLHILSNGQLKTALHQVVVDRIQHRVSVAYFCGPPGNAKVSPVEKLVGPGRAPAYRGVTWAEYKGIRMKLFDKALASLKAQEESKELCGE
ncbi:gibberellin 3-beta-dioxygenase 1 [Cocos nucifera]|uniref:gibberellin 3beta-dioxygenase n=1 Tax=Cocos nucifera TaxID=13894 RepID=A0A8K0MVG2_COCNU|nr:gibberellin 3-beta-dioxygenase 1 [Cocos nucifera]